MAYECPDSYLYFARITDLPLVEADWIEIHGNAALSLDRTRPS